MNSPSGRVFATSTGSREGVLEMPLKNATVGDIMTRSVKTLGLNETLDVADDIMTFDRIRHLPVVDDRRVVGVVSQRDLFRSALASTLGYGEKARTELLRSIRVKEVMSEPPVTTTPGTPLPDAARVMVQRKIGCLPVVVEGEIVGLVTETDLLRRIAEL